MAVNYYKCDDYTSLRISDSLYIITYVKSTLETLKQTILPLITDKNFTKSVKSIVTNGINDTKQSYRDDINGYYDAMLPTMIDMITRFDASTKILSPVEKMIYINTTISANNITFLSNSVNELNESITFSLNMFELLNNIISTIIEQFQEAYSLTMTEFKLDKSIHACQFSITNLVDPIKKNIKRLDLYLTYVRYISRLYSIELDKWIINYTNVIEEFRNAIHTSLSMLFPNNYIQYRYSITQPSKTLSEESCYSRQIFILANSNLVNILSSNDIAGILNSIDSNIWKPYEILSEREYGDAYYNNR